MSQAELRICLMTGQTVSLQPVPRIQEVLYQYKPLQVETYGPLAPDLEQLSRFGYEFMFPVLRHSQRLGAPSTSSIYTPCTASHNVQGYAPDGGFHNGLTVLAMSLTGRYPELCVNRENYEQTANATL
ncbi:hypothetical protein GOODEAATRI_000104 [Goodea atripinnis]|uniref:Uncharacterized protein n=1 Tax=Goodea atripinnis TaxID=208336 RepID=A0ABV0P0H1_9TELE